ncbi:TonB-dependent receptor [Photobacterium sp. WH77]|uniref:TonB-dependent receptor n=1 Tax=unclassified Photobacterium TaxID=2628852 RepID=UPI001ED9F949|nr:MULTISPECIES: TonB-dependent receptor [unclassified Photobacterium]MCG2839063.1 TonB-dependent receptor [Photobacterium sp. WH77]MCG2846680.1 TonB-dependent receptor [Photobacterium sp. WH80]
MKRHHIIGLGVLPVTCLNAQDQIPHTAPDDIIVVEAKYWPESGQDIPATRHFIPSESIATPAQENIERLSQYAANTIVENSSVQPRVVIRGQSSLDTGLSSPVGYMIDDVSLPLGIRQAPDFLGIDYIDLIKGAQGSYYGRNSESGVIKVHSLTPGREMSGWGAYSYLQSKGGESSAPGHQIEAGIQGGSETIAGILAVRSLDAESPYYNQFRQSSNENELTRLHVMAGMTYAPNAQTAIQVRSRWQDSDDGRATMRYLTGPLATERFVVNQNTLSDENETTSVHSLRIDHDFGPMALTAITGYTDYLQDFIIDPDTGPAPIAATTSYLHDISVSQEIRIAGTQASGLQWAAGTYLFQQDTHVDFTMGFSGLARDTLIEHRGIAGFGHLQIPLTPALSLTAGLRVEHSEQEGAMSGVSPQNVTQTLDDTQWLPNLISHYRFSPQQLAYLSWSTGYLPGGFNYSSALSDDNFTYDAEYTNSFEAGYQSDWLDHDLHIEAALFYNQIRDKQMLDILPGMVQKITNAAEADIYGLEMLADWQFNSLWSVRTQVGLQHGEGQQTSNNASGQTTNDLPYTPDYTWSVGLRYSPLPTLDTELAVRGSDTYFFDSQNTLKQDAYEVVDFSATYLLSPVTLTFAVNNLFDEEIFSRAVNTPAGAIVEDTQPRTFSITANYQW